MRLLDNLRSSCNSILPVPLNSSNMTSSIFEEVSVRAVAMMVSEPPPSIFLAAPKKRLGLWSALASTPPERILPLAGDTVLYARASLVIESSIMTTSWPLSTRRLAFSSTMPAIFTCLSAGSSKVDAITSALTERAISVTSSGRSSMRSIIIYVSGWFSAMALAISFSRMVLPVFGGATIRARCPLPMGANMSTTRVEIFPLRPDVRSNFSSGKSGTRCSNGVRSRISSGVSPLIRLILHNGKYFSPSRGGRMPPSTTSPALRP